MSSQTFQDIGGLPGVVEEMLVDARLGDVLTKIPCSGSWRAYQQQSSSSLEGEWL